LIIGIVLLVLFLAGLFLRGFLEPDKVEKELAEQKRDVTRVRG
jgi:hypothetical protein